MFTRPGMAQEGLWKIIATAWTVAWILCDPTGLWGFLSQDPQSSPLVEKYQSSWSWRLDDLGVPPWQNGNLHLRSVQKPSFISLYCFTGIPIMDCDIFWYIVNHEHPLYIYIRSSCSLMLDSAAAELWILQTGLHIYIYVNIYIYCIYM